MKDAQSIAQHGEMLFRHTAFSWGKLPGLLDSPGLQPSYLSTSSFLSQLEGIAHELQHYTTYKACNSGQVVSSAENTAYEAFSQLEGISRRE